MGTENKRICSECGKEMKDGYVIDGGMEYFCSDECLHKHYTDEEYLEMYDEGNGDSYWTEWDDEGAATNSDQADFNNGAQGCV